MNSELITVTGTLSSILYTKPDGSWGIALVYVEDGGGQVERGSLKVTGEGAPSLPPEVTLKLVGTLDDHPQHGLQLKLVSYSSEGITTGDGAFRWLKRLDGVGDVLAERLYKHFGEEIVDVLNHDSPIGDPLQNVPGIGTATIEAIRESWNDLKVKGDIEDLRFFDAHGLSHHDTKALLQFFKGHPACKESVREGVVTSLWDAYPAMSWTRLDRISRKLTLNPFAAGRVHAAVQEAIHRISKDTGSTCLRRQDVSWRACVLGSLMPDTAEQAMINMEQEGEVRWVGFHGHTYVMSERHFDAETLLFNWATGAA